MRHPSLTPDASDADFLRPDDTPAQNLTDDLYTQGNLGLGTNTPQHTLEVDGDARIQYPNGTGKTIQIQANDALWPELLPPGFWKGAWMNLNDPSQFTRTTVSVSDHYEGGEQAIMEYFSALTGKTAKVRAWRDPATNSPRVTLQAQNPGQFTGSLDVNTHASAKTISLTATPAGVGNNTLVFAMGPQGYSFSVDGVKHFPTQQDAVNGGVTSTGVLYQTGSWLRLSVQESFLNAASPSLPRFYVLSFNYEKSDGTLGEYTTPSTVHDMATLPNYTPGSRHYVSIDDTGAFILSTTGFTVGAAKVGVIDVDATGTITNIIESFLGDIAHNRRA